MYLTVTVKTCKLFVKITIIFYSVETKFDQMHFFWGGHLWSVAYFICFIRQHLDLQYIQELELSFPPFHTSHVTVMTGHSKKVIYNLPSCTNTQVNPIATNAATHQKVNTQWSDLMTSNVNIWLESTAELPQDFQII